MVIPIFVRSGDLQATVSFADAGFDQETSKLTFTMNRSGNRSVYGDIEIFSGHEDPVLLGKVSGVAIYTEVNSLSLDQVLKEEPQSGSLKISFLEDEKYGGDIRYVEEISF